MAPSTEGDHAGDILHISGWGKPSDGKSPNCEFENFLISFLIFYIFFHFVIYSAATGISPTLNEVEVPCITNAECAATYGATITDGNICVDTTGGKGSCNVRLIRLISKFLTEITFLLCNVRRVTLAAHWATSTTESSTKSVSSASAHPLDAKLVSLLDSLAFPTSLTGSRPSLDWSSKLSKNPLN